MKNNKYNTGYTTPTNYFNTLEDRVLNKIHNDTLPNSTGFNVPDGYFEVLEQSVLSQGQNNVPKVISLNKRNLWITVTSVAACALFILGLVTRSDNNIAVENLQTDAISAYIEEGNLDFSTQDIAALFQEDELRELNMTSVEVPEENLTDYLLNTVDDPNLLIE